MRQPSVVECSVCVAGREALLGLEQHPRRARHRLHAADHDAATRRRSRSRGSACIAASSDEPQSRLTVVAGHARRQPGEQHRHARDVAVVLAGAVGVAEEHVVDRARGRAPARARRARARRARRGRRAARRPARRRSGRTACGRRRRRRRVSHRRDQLPQRARAPRSVGSARWCASVVGDPQRPSRSPRAPARPSTPGCSCGQRQLAVASGSSTPRSVITAVVRAPDGREEVELARRTCAASAARSRRPRAQPVAISGAPPAPGRRVRGCVVVADHGRVEVARGGRPARRRGRRPRSGPGPIQ